MTAKTITTGFSAMQELLRGVDALTDAAAVTLGPRGRTVIIEEPSGLPRITKDGVTVIRAVFLSNHIQDVGAKLIREACERMLDETGDGTTTVAVLARSLAHECIKATVGAGVNPQALKRALAQVEQMLLVNLLAQAENIHEQDELARVATVSANGDAELGGMIAEALERTGRHGFVTVEAGQGMETTLETTKGLRFDQGYLSSHFVTDKEKNTALLESPLIALYGDIISDFQMLLPLLELAQNGKRPLLLVADDVTGEALALLTINAQRGALKIVAVKAPSYGEARIELIEDMAALTGAQFIQPSLGKPLDQVTEEMLGSARQVIVSRTETTLTEGRGNTEVISERAQQIKQAMESAETPQQREALQKRLASLRGGMAVIRIGGTTEPEIRERLDRADDALRAAQAAQEEGIVAGGGVALFRAAQKLDAKTTDPVLNMAIKMIKRAAEAPLRRIAENSGIDGSLVAGKLLREDNPHYGFDARTREYGNLMERGIIDPLKVIRIGIQQAVSVATLLMLTEVTVTEQQEQSTTN